MKRHLLWIAAAGALLLLLSTGGVFWVLRQGESASEATAQAASVEQPVVEIPLAGALTSPQAELSALAWYGEHLILAPQYPDFGGGGSFFYALPKADILAFLDGALAGPLEPQPIPLVVPNLRQQIDGFEGFEALALAGERAFLTIEAAPGNAPRAYLVAGTMAADLSMLTIDAVNRVEIPPQSGSANRSDEALLVVGDAVVTIYEVNGAALNPAPLAHVFDLDLAPRGVVPFPSIEYRITDATAVDAAGRFWAIDYQYPGDEDLWPASDPLAEQYGCGVTHCQYEQVERLVQFEYDQTGITLVGTPPLLLTLVDEARNWEGLVRLDERGFLLVTDKFPATILGFVALP